MSVGGDDIHLHRDILAGSGDCAVYGVFYTSAAGYFHARYRNAPDIVGADYPAQFLSIVGVVQLGAADEGNSAFDVPAVEISVGVGGAVGGDKQVAAPEIGSLHSRKLDLNRDRKSTRLNSSHNA